MLRSPHLHQTKKLHTVSLSVKQVQEAFASDVVYGIYNWLEVYEEIKEQKKDIHRDITDELLYLMRATKNAYTLRDTIVIEQQNKKRGV